MNNYSCSGEGVNFHFLSRLRKLPNGKFDAFALRQIYSTESGESKYITKQDFLKDFFVHFYGETLGPKDAPEVTFVGNRHSREVITVFATKALANKYLVKCHSKELQPQLEVCPFEVSGRTLLQSEIIQHICRVLANGPSVSNSPIMAELIRSAKLQAMAHDIFEYGITELTRVSTDYNLDNGYGYGDKKMTFHLKGIISETGRYKASNLSAGDTIELDYSVAIASDVLRQICLDGMEVKYRPQPSVPYVSPFYL